jgi:hypothetical protein
VPLLITVAVRRVARPPKTVTPSVGTAVAGVRVQLVNSFGDVLVEAVTPADGRLQLRREILPGSALTVRFPALGIAAALPESGELVLTLPGMEESP